MAAQPRKKRVFRAHPERVRTLLRAIQHQHTGHAERRIAEHATASKKNLLHYGKPFLYTFAPKEFFNHHVKVSACETTHESSVGLQVEFKNRPNGLMIIGGTIKLGFESKTVIIEGIQGWVKEHGVKELNAILGQPWPNFLVELAEAHARKEGYEYVAIRRPETQYWFQRPITGHEEGDPVKHTDKIDEIQARMKGMYARIAKAMGYRKEKEYFVKKL